MGPLDLHLMFAALGERNQATRAAQQGGCSPMTSITTVSEGDHRRQAAIGHN